MRFFFWLIVFTAAFVLETAALPQVLNGFTPSLTLAVLLLGVAFQPFWSGFAFAAFAGLLLDIASGGGIHTFIALGTFLAVRTFSLLMQWEEPLGRIGAVAIGLILQPPLRFIGAEFADLAFGVTVPGVRLSDAFGIVAVRETMFALLWFASFAWFEIRRARRHRGQRLRHL